NKLSSVYAVTTELDEWRRSRSQGESKSEEPPAKKRGLHQGWAYGILVLVGLVAAAGLFKHLRQSPQQTAFPSVLPLPSLTREQPSASFSSDGKSVAFGWGSETDLQYSVCTKLILGGQPNCFSRSDKTEFSPNYSPDGNWLAYLGGPHNERSGLYL